MPGDPLHQRAQRLPVGTVQVEQLGATAPLKWTLGDDALIVIPASAKPASDAGIVLKITLK